MTQNTENPQVCCQQCGTPLENPKPGQRAVICPCCGAAYVVHSPNAGWLRRNWELMQYRYERRREARRKAGEQTVQQTEMQATQQPQKPAVQRPWEQSGQQTEKQVGNQKPVPRKAGKKRWIGLILLAAAAVLIIGALLVVPSLKAGARSRQWQKLYHSQMLPEPDFPIEKVADNRKDSLWVWFSPVEKSQMMAYLRACEDMGYQQESMRSHSKIHLFSAEGWTLTLSYLELQQKLYLELKPPVPLEPIKWPFESLPSPDCGYYHIAYQNGEAFHAFAGPMDHDQWSQYVDQLMAMGYICQLDRYDNRFSGALETGETVSVQYRGHQVVEIRRTLP